MLEGNSVVIWLSFSGMEIQMESEPIPTNHKCQFILILIAVDMSKASVTQSPFHGIRPTGKRWQ
jgi:hypothetical protein